MIIKIFIFIFVVPLFSTWEVIMKAIARLCTLMVLLFSFSFSYAGLKKNLTPEEEKWVDESSVQICNGTVPLYGVALDEYYHGKKTPQVITTIKKRYDSDEKKQLFYTKYIDKDGLTEAIVSVTEPHAKKIMEKYPGDWDTYKMSIDRTNKVTLPPVCQADMKKVLRDILQE